MEKLLAAMKTVRAIIVEGAMTGFNPLDGDWAERLFASQGPSSWAVKEAEQLTLMEWCKIDANGFGVNDIDLTAHYIVKTNADEWRDFDLEIMKGFVVCQKLHPNYVRGRPVWIAKINRPKEEAK